MAENLNMNLDRIYDLAPGMSAGEFRLLSLLAGKYGGETTQHTLADHLHRTPPAINKLVKQLERRGYVTQIRTGVCNHKVVRISV